MATDMPWTVSREEIRRLGTCARVLGAPYVEQLWLIYERASDEETRLASFDALASLTDGHTILG